MRRLPGKLALLLLCPLPALFAFQLRTPAPWPVAQSPVVKPLPIATALPVVAIAEPTLPAQLALSIVTADTRPLPDAFDNSSVFSVFAVALQHFAALHSHPLTRLVYKSPHYRKTCSHPVHGMRHASWCKLLAVQRVLASSTEGSLVLWMDSDAGLGSASLDVITMLRTSGTGRVRHACTSVACAEHKERSCLYPMANYPAEGENCMASVFLLRNDACGRDVLRRWWNVGICAHEFPWEQRALNSILYPASFQASQWNISQLAVGPNYRAAGQPFVHFGHTHTPAERLALAHAAVARFFGGALPFKNETQRLHDAAKRAEVVVDEAELKALSRALAGGGNLTAASGSDLLELLDPTRRLKLEKGECFYMGYSPPTP